MVHMLNHLTVAPLLAMQHRRTNLAFIKVVLVLLGATDQKSCPNPLPHYHLTLLGLGNRLYASRFPENYGGVEEFIDSDQQNNSLPNRATQTQQEIRRGRGGVRVRSGVNEHAR